MKVSEFSINLPRVFISLRCLEKTYSLQKRRGTEESPSLVISFPIDAAARFEILKKDTSPVKIMTVLQRARFGGNVMETLCQSVR